MNNPMFGSCFCENIKFEISGITPKLYQCHCSMCRKVTSSSANTGCIIPKENFSWLTTNDITSFLKPTGYRVDFCPICGSTVPNPYRDNAFWIPMGLLDGEYNLQISNHLCVSSKASWERISDNAKQHNGVPNINQIATHSTTKNELEIK